MWYTLPVSREERIQFCSPTNAHQGVSPAAESSGSVPGNQIPLSVPYPDAERESPSGRGAEAGSHEGPQFGGPTLAFSHIAW